MSTENIHRSIRTLRYVLSAVEQQGTYAVVNGGVAGHEAKKILEQAREDIYVLLDNLLVQRQAAIDEARAAEHDPFFSEEDEPEEVR